MDKPSILIVTDDKPVSVRPLAKVFAARFNVLIAFNAKKALKILNEERISLVICDIIVPGADLDNLQFCALIKTADAFSHIPIILLFPRNDLENKIAGLRNGADACIEKPFPPEYLEAKVCSLLQNIVKVKAHFSGRLPGTLTTSFTPAGKRFSITLHSLIEEYLTDSLLDIRFLATRLHMSRGSLYRKIKEISDLSPTKIIEMTRLKRAVTLIQERQYKMNEIALMTGYSSAAQFSKSFKRRFGMAPMQYAKQQPQLAKEEKWPHDT